MSISPFRALLVLLLSLGAVSLNARGPRPPSAGGLNLLPLAQSLDHNLAVSLLRNRPMAVATASDLDHLDQTSPLGRIIQETLQHHLVCLGYRLVEPRLSPPPLNAQPDGETALSRPVPDLPELEAVVACTYARLPGSLLISARVVERGTRLVRASAQVTLPLNDEIEALISPPRARTSSTPVLPVAVLERPVRRSETL